MVVTMILSISILLQYVAAFLAIRLIRVTEKTIAWYFIATAVFLMGVRRSITLYRLVSGDLARPPDLTAELVALGISTLMVIGISRIGPLFQFLKYSKEKLRKQSENLSKLVEERTGELTKINKHLAQQIAESARMGGELKEKVEKLEKTRRAMLYMVEDLNATRKELQQEIEVRKRAEEEIRRYATRLQSANKDLESFSYSVSHDLRAPLRAIDGFSNILLEEQSARLDDDGKRVLNVIRDNTRNMGQLIDDLLSFSRFGRQELKVTDIDMDSLFKGTVKEAKMAEPERKLEFKVEALPSAKGDQALVRQVVENLVFNAAKFTRPKDDAVVEIGSKTEDKQNVYYVKDNGVGFDMVYIDKLFNVFQRLHRKDEFEGTGVGLAIVKRIIDRHGGRVWAEGKVGEGAAFYFSLPKK